MTPWGKVSGPSPLLCHRLHGANAKVSQIYHHYFWLKKNSFYILKIFTVKKLFKNVEGKTSYFWYISVPFPALWKAPMYVKSMELTGYYNKIFVSSH